MTKVKWYTAYNTQTGQIVSVFSDDGKTVERNTPQNCSVIEGKYDQVDGYIEGDQFVQRPDRPSSIHIFDWTSKTWIDPRTVEDLKAQKWSELKAIRDQKEFGGFYWNNLKFDSDSVSQSRIMGAVQLATLNPNYTVEWTLADNTTTALSAQDILAVGVSLGSHVGSLHEISRLLRQQLDLSTSKEEIDQIVWPG